MGEWFGEFGAALPDALRAAYQFGDPYDLGRGWVGLVVMVLWVGPLMILPLWLAKIFRGKREWLSAAMGVMAGSSFLWWLHGVIPHAWIQFTESNENVLSGTIIPATAGIDINPDYRLDIASNLYSVITEGVVGAMMVIGIVLTCWLALRVQKSLPKTLAPGETKPEAGGYK
ncbi:hypothetical protein [Egicoccus halophilus]|uniref:Uncharacterized protein n=1 Tax=Egicoccus halophilus TaxID=1670830 RepID=A0A8J3A7K5_9ACTN|nr:hypothetical protein [Egicoccus halophilus]GGI05671.1 hypothetical protein GCM10011354_15250 [Egicoccus halophilus]